MRYFADDFYDDYDYGPCNDGEDCGPDIDRYDFPYEDPSWPYEWNPETGTWED